ncbi:HD domain-containing protein [Helicobacter saguini]
MPTHHPINENIESNTQKPPHDTIDKNKPRKINYILLIEQFLYEFFERVVLTDIKPPVFHKLKATHGAELSEFVESTLKNELENYTFFKNMREYLANKNSHIQSSKNHNLDSKTTTTFEPKNSKNHSSNSNLYSKNPNFKEQNIESKILSAAHFYASKWEFDIIYHFNPKLYDMENIKRIIDAQNESFYDLEGMKNAILYSDLREVLGMFAELRFQKRWSQTPRIPQTSVLGHMLIVAISAFLLSCDLNVCEQMRLNHFFGGLFHDLPEVLTRDIISPIKRSVKGLDGIIKGIEKEEMESKILSRLPEFIARDIRFWSENEFANRVILGDCVRCDIESSEIFSRYNENEYRPVCGELLKFCDKLSAFLEARISIAHGLSSPDLLSGSLEIYEQLKDKKINGMDVGFLLKEFM